jgi:vesicular inhibitory amino acid transporter
MRDRRLSRLADEQDDERSRSRSRSPKRLGAAARGRGVPPALRAQLRDEQQRQHYDLSSDGSSALARGSRPSPATASSDEFAAAAAPTEHTRLLPPGAAPRRRSSGMLEAQQRRASYAKSSGMSSGARFAAQGYGSSTFWQSWFNTVNALVGVGIL